MPQPPQDSELLCASISHPSSALGEAGFMQLALPSTQLEVQRPPEHASDITPLVLQARVHVPQRNGSVERLASQPSLAVPLQSV